MHILPNISRSKRNQTLKYGQIKEHNKKIFFFKNHAENEAGRLAPELFLFFKKTLLAIYKTRNTGTGNGMRGMQGTRGMFTRIPGNVLILAFRGIFEKIPGNAREDSGECY